MWLDEVTVSLRPRNPWEAMDLGFAIVRREWRAVYLAWFAATLPLFIALNLVLYDIAWLAGLVFWWLKPFYDRVVLWVVSQALFGSRPPLRESLRKALELRRNGLILALTLLRLDPARSFDLPTHLLEGLRGKARRRRQRVLNHRGHGHAVWLTVACVNLELVCYLSLLVLVWLLVPDTLLAPLLSILETGIPGGFDTVFNLAYYVAVSIIEPCYVAGGFSLYVNRRTVLEGWDIELQFRQMARRLSASVRPATAAALTLVAALLLPPLVAPALASDAGDVDRRAAEDPAEVIARVLSAPEFQVTERRETWVPKRRTPDGENGRGSLIGPETAELIARVARLLMWLMLGYLVLALLVSIWRYRAGRRVRPLKSPTARQEPVAPRAPAEAAAVPSNPSTAARSLWSAGDPRGAMSLLYRASLARLAARGALPVIAVDTERDVERRLEELNDPGLKGYLSRLIAVWRLTAYRHTPPPGDEGMNLIEEWAHRFGETGR